MLYLVAYICSVYVVYICNDYYMSRPKPMFIYALHACNKCILFLPIKYVVKSLNNTLVYGLCHTGRENFIL